MQTIESLLQSGIEQLNLPVDCDKLVHYLNLLIKWNKTYNLTAIKQADEMVIKHLLDSLSVAKHIKGQRLLDVGTGAGLPGIPLALLFGDKHFTLLDSNGKKTRFLNQVKRELSLNNVDIVQIRCENYHPQPAFDTVISRAFASIDDMIKLTKHLLDSKGQWLAMKGKKPDAQLQQLNYNQQCIELSVPFLADERCLVVIDNN